MQDYDQQHADWAFGRLGNWGRRVMAPSCAHVAPGSQLDTPEIADTGHTPARVVWRAFGTAGEHAGAAHSAVELTGGGVRTKPFLTAARTVMLGAARALFVLEPDDPTEREVRALQLLRAEAHDLDRLIADWETSTGSVDAGWAKARQDADDFRTACETQLLARGKRSGSKISETDLLTRVAPHLSGGTQHDPLIIVMNLWRLGSGTAHARSWAWDSGLEDEPFAVQMAAVWTVPMGLMEAAWILWCERRGSTADVD